MKRIALVLIAASLVAGAIACGDGGGGQDEPTAGPTAVMELPQGDEPVELDAANFVAEIDNQYWPMRPGNHWVYTETDADGTEMTVDVTVTTDTRVIAGISATVVHDVVSEDGQVIEDTFDWYAQDVDGNIWYMGEDTKEYENGEVVSTEGSWEHGVDGAMAGVIMPANPVVGMSYRQEYYEGEAEDQGKVLSVGDHVEVPFGTYDLVLRTEDTTPLEPDVLEHKYYAPFVGPVLTVDVNGGGREELTLFEAARASDVPELTPEDETRAKEIISNDPYLAEMRGASSMTVDDAGVWHIGLVKLGAAAQVHFDPPVTWEGPWHFVIFPSEDATPSPDPASNYRLETHRARVEGMVDASVLVDLTDGTVVQIHATTRTSFGSLDTPDPRWTRQPQR